MYAVIETGGKQYRVELGSEFAVERLEGTPGDTIRFDRVLLVADGDKASVGTPVVDDALVTANLVRHDRGEKLIVFKYRPKARHRAKNGHRQEQTIVRIADISFGGRSAASEAEVVNKEASKAKVKAAAEAQKKATADQALAAKLEADAQAKADAKATDESAVSKTTAKPTTAAPKPAAKKTAPKAEATSKSSAAPKPAAKKAAPAKTVAKKEKD